MTAQELRTHKERVLFGISAAVSAVAWLAIGVSVIGLAYSALVAVAVLMAHALHMAHVTGNGVRVSSGQLPEIHQKVQEASRKLGLASAPEVYIVQAGGILNAFATKLLSRRFVIIYSDLLDSCDVGEPGKATELDFIIGHEIGHLAAGHLAWQWFLCRPGSSRCSARPTRAPASTPATSAATRSSTTWRFRPARSRSWPPVGALGDG